jgi:8-oxo-dGTP pyrophosphatase MutT (NUDIX family)
VIREFSAGGVVVRRIRGTLHVAAIRPQGRPAGHWALPKGLVARGESVVDAAVREVAEETGLVCDPVRRVDALRYVYQRDGERIFKVVTFWLMHPRSGRIGEIDESMRVEVAEARWLPLAEAPKLLAYRGERALVAALIADGVS